MHWHKARPMPFLMVNFKRFHTDIKIMLLSTRAAQERNGLQTLHEFCAKLDFRYTKYLGMAIYRL